MENRINYEISSKINEVLEEAKQRAEDYRDAVLATGGTMEDFIPTQINVDYEITYQDDGTQIVPYPGGISHDNNFGDFINTLSADGQQTTLKVTLKDADDNIIDERYVTYPGDKETVMEQITTEAVKNGATIE